MKSRSIAFFDFDGTISKRDSLWLFLKFYFGSPKLYFKLIPFLPKFLAYKLGIVGGSEAKEKLFSILFSQVNYSYFEGQCKDFALSHLIQDLKQEALEKISWHQQRGDQLVLVSASIEPYLKFVAEELKLDLIATKIEVIDGRISGNFDGKNCSGQEKVARIEQKYTLSEYDEIYAYGDSAGDKEMLALADRAFYKLFKK